MFEAKLDTFLKDKPSEFKNLVFFSTGYPYETTLLNELKVLSQYFDNIYYIPSVINKPFNNNDFPDNVIAVSLFKNVEINYRKLFKKHFFNALFIFLREALSSRKPIQYFKSYKTYLSIAATGIEKYCLLKDFINVKNLSTSTLFYDYWFENSTLALAMLRKQGLVEKAICRTHRFDLYDEAWEGNPVPYRNFKVKHLDAIYAIAQHGQNYLRSRVKNKYHNKIGISYLGVEQPLFINVPNTDSNFSVIVSISNTQPFKRVHIIPDVLMQIDKPIKWVHFGEGPMDSIILEKINNLPTNITVDWKGRVPNNQIHEFYKFNKVDLFVSLSISEGLPISMMETISYGIPVFAGNICGIPELINETTGLLFEKTNSINDIAIKLSSALQKNFDREKIVQFASSKFDYKTNYVNFCNQITQ